MASARTILLSIVQPGERSEELKIHPTAKSVLVSKFIRTFTFILEGTHFFNNTREGKTTKLQ